LIDLVASDVDLDGGPGEAARDGVELSAYVSGLLRPAVEREFRKTGRELLGEDGAAS
jgi:hypothetical protein